MGCQFGCLLHAVLWHTCYATTKGSCKKRSSFIGLIFNQILANSLYIGIIVAMIPCAIYMWNHRTKAVFFNVASIVLISQAVVGGPFLCLKALFVANCDFSSSEKLYVLVGGIAVAWNAIISLTKIVTKPKAPG